MALRAGGISYRYDGLRALDGVSLEIDDGELALVCGPNGSGKSTLLRCLAGLARPAGGTVLIDGRAARSARPSVGLAVQFPERALFERAVFDEVAFGPRNRGLPEGRVGACVEAALAAVGLAVDRRAAPRNLSYGQKRLLAVAAAIAHGPRYLFLDEPAAGLDALGRASMARLLESLRPRMTVVAATHDPLPFWDACTRIIALDGGRVVADGPPGPALADRIGLRSEALTLARLLRARGLHIHETLSPEELADEIAEALAHEGHV